MPQEFTMQAALVKAAQTEKNVMDFYLRATQIVTDPGAKKVFSTLAREEREHAASFFHLCAGGELGTFDEFISAPSARLVIHEELEKVLDQDVHERRAMELALCEEEDLARQLEFTASHIVDPGVRQIFDRMAKETRNHYAIIESEYARMMGMVHETDIDTFVRE
ncbi:MAG: ferritin family protein [Desulfuromonadales bacterium]|nr:ferritin family protein [Desulfuromonadales bacterium]MDT8422298.1 ferritin family protein [Desulfuromonadales bacterium]